MKKLLNLGLLRRKVFLALPPVSNVVYRQMKSPWERITILMTSLDRGAKDLADLDTVIEWLRNCLEIALAARVTIIEDRAALEQIFPLPLEMVRPEQLQIAQDNADADDYDEDAEADALQKWHEAEFGSDDEPDDAEADDKPS